MGLVLGPSRLELMWTRVLLMGAGVAESRAVSTWELGRGVGAGRGHKEGPGCLPPSEAAPIRGGTRSFYDGGCCLRGPGCPGVGASCC